MIKNAKVELRISNSLYRADVFGELLCGTPCIIEVIKTSKVSEVKKEFIKDAQKPISYFPKTSMANNLQGVDVSSRKVNEN